MVYIIDSFGRVKFVAASFGNLPDPGANGIVVRTASQLVIARTLVAGSTKLAVTNGDGVSGNPSVDLGTLTTSDIPNLDASKITTGQLALARGGTNADLSGTGGVSKFLRQNSAGAAITVVQPASSDLSDAANVPLINANNHFTGTGNQIFDGTVKPALSQMFSWTSKLVNTVYTAASDGFLIGYAIVAAGTTNQRLTIASDTSNPPTTTRVIAGADNAGAGVMNIPFCCPIRKGDNYQAGTNNAITATMWWVPLGTAG